jgi:hypothetical protein
MRVSTPILARGVKHPCSRIQRRRARATSARSRSAACRLFFDSDVVASEETRERTTAGLDAALSQRANYLIQRQIRLLADQSENSLRVLLQRRNTSSARDRLRSPVAAKALHPSDCGTNADDKLFGRLSSGSPASTKSMTRTLIAPGYGPYTAQTPAESMH